MSTNSNLDINPPSPGLGSSKYGTLVPNRIFVGGISSTTSEAELHSLFSKYGNVKATKIIMDKAGISKGYGFVTFETEEEAQRIQKEVESIVLKDRKLNIAPAIKKQPFSRVLADPAQMISNSAILYPSSVPQSYSNAALINGSDNLYLPQAPYPVVYPQHVFLPQQYYQTSASATYPTQYVYAVPASSEVYAYGSAVPHSGGSPNDYAESSSSEVSNEGVKATYAKPSAPPITVTSEYESNRMLPAKHARTSSSGSSYRNSSMSVSNIPSVNSLASPHFHPLPSQYLHHPLFKSANGVTVMTYPNSIMMGTPTIFHVRDPNVGDHEAITELAFFHSSLATGALTPPPTPITAATCDFGSSNNESGRKN